MRLISFRYVAMTVMILSLQPLTALAAPATQPAGDDAFLRFIPDRNGGAQLKTTITTYTKGNVAVHLIAALHVADKSFYDAKIKQTTLKGAPMHAVKEGNLIRAPELVMCNIDDKDKQNMRARGASGFDPLPLAAA